MVRSVGEYLSVEKSQIEWNVISSLPDLRLEQSEDRLVVRGRELGHRIVLEVRDVTQPFAAVENPVGERGHSLEDCLVRVGADLKLIGGRKCNSIGFGKAPEQN